MKVNMLVGLSISLILMALVLAGCGQCPLGAKRCVGGVLVQECVSVPEADNTWQVKEDCAQQNDSVCYAGECTQGCLYEGAGYPEGLSGCVNETTFAECTGGQAIFTVCPEGQACLEDECVVPPEE